MERRIEEVFVRFLMGEETMKGPGVEARDGGKTKKGKGRGKAGRKMEAGDKSYNPNKG